MYGFRNVCSHDGKILFLDINDLIKQKYFMIDI